MASAKEILDKIDYEIRALEEKIQYHKNYIYLLEQQQKKQKGQKATTPLIKLLAPELTQYNAIVQKIEQQNKRNLISKLVFVIGIIMCIGCLGLLFGPIVITPAMGGAILFSLFVIIIPAIAIAFLNLGLSNGGDHALAQIIEEENQKIIEQKNPHLEGLITIRKQALLDVEKEQIPPHHANPVADPPKTTKEKEIIPPATPSSPTDPHNP